MTAEESSPQQAGISTSQTARAIGFEEFIEAASRAVLRAIEVRKADQSSPLIRFPIVIGIIYMPDGGADLTRIPTSISAGKEGTS